MAEPLLSVIVPVYKTEPYLRKCLDSVVNQTYSRLEIILVDDGSPDNSGAICDEYAAQDSRIRVIHQKNGGLSAARNVGIQEAGGEFVALLDSDDYLDTDMYRQMMEKATQEAADIVICDFYSVKETGNVYEGLALSTAVQTEEIRKLVLMDKISSYVWNKIYHKKMFEGIQFKEVRGYEDLMASPEIFRRAQKITYLPKPFYYYNCLNVNSISAVYNQDRKINVREKYGLFTAWQEHERVARETCHDAVSLSETRAVRSAISSLVADAANRILTEKERQHVFAYLSGKKQADIGRKHRMLWFFAKYSRLACKLYDYGSSVWRQHKLKRLKTGS